MSCQVWTFLIHSKESSIVHILFKLACHLMSAEVRATHHVFVVWIAWLSSSLVGIHSAIHHVQETRASWFITFFIVLVTYVIFLLLSQQFSGCGCILDHALSVPHPDVLLLQKAFSSLRLFTATFSDHVFWTSLTDLFNIHRCLAVGPSRDNLAATLRSQAQVGSSLTHLNELVDNVSNQEEKHEERFIECHC